MNNTLTLLEITVVSSAMIQIMVILATLYIMTLRDKKIWGWLAGGCFGILLRRIAAMLRFSGYSWVTLEIDYIITFLVSACFMVFLIMIIYKDRLGKGGK